MVYGMNIVGDIWKICNCLIFSYVFFSVDMYVVMFVYFVCWYVLLCYIKCFCCGCFFKYLFEIKVCLNKYD